MDEIEVYNRSQVRFQICITPSSGNLIHCTNGFAHYLPYSKQYCLVPLMTYFLRYLRMTQLQLLSLQSLYK
ncbi:hypothetical protein L596_011607 [Steinernema carpocapsae]|uniref:Uncharacterized protein n=1 Tax=Steinernema carpocapsae TaxID=34508 RepID=A0A4U5NUG0_STECR|nr:hypothetical protein L596_011607 [Steinernema carpocapsae]